MIPCKQTAVAITCAAVAATVVFVPAVPAQQTLPPTTAPAGQQKSGKMQALEAGAKALQSNAPLQPFDVYLVGFHPMKDHPDMQVEAHHYCKVTAGQHKR